MFKYRLPAAVATALLITTFGPAQAQDKDAAHQPPAQTAKAQQAPAAAAPAAPGAAKSPDTPKTPAPTDVVGSVFGKQITWADFLQRIRADQPAQFTLIASQVAGQKVATGLFGPTGQSQITISQDDIYAAIRQNPPTQIVGMLDSILLTDAFKEEAAKANVTVTDAQVQDSINTSLKRIRSQGQIPPTQTDQQWLDNFYKTQNITKEQLFNNVRQSMLPFALFEKEVDKQLGHPNTPADFVQIRWLLIKAPQLTASSKPEDRKADAAALAKADKIAAEIKAGKVTFAQAVKDNSEDFATKAQGGEIPPFMRGTQSKEIEDQAFALKTNEVSKPIRTAVGYYLVQVEKAGKDVPEETRQQILRARETQASQPYVTALRQRANITNNLRPIAGIGGPGGGPGGPGPGGAQAAPRGASTRQ
jgi:peptidyl-prolyl cis-trans isomerase C